MKKIYALFSLIVVVLMAACTHEEEDLFKDSSAVRADAAVKANMEILAGASNGWHMEYFPASMQQYGGYNLLLKFDSEGKVTVSSELYGPTDAVTSYYSIKQSAGIILSFDTYNEIFHLFSDPGDPMGVGGNGYGMEGDYDFLIVEATPEKVLLKGKKTGGYAVMTPMEEDWSKYITSIQSADAAMSFRKFEIQIAGQAVDVSVSYRTLTFNYQEDEEDKSQTASYIVTPTGYKFYESLDILGKSIAGFTFDPVSQAFSELSDETIKMTPVIPPLNEQFVTGNWFIAYSHLGAYAQTYFAYCKQNFLDLMGEELYYAFMGSLLYGSFGFNFNSSGYAGLLGYDYQLIGEDKVTLTFNFTGQGNGVWYYNNAGFYYFLNPFGYDSSRTFTITADNPKNPTYITLTEDANPDNVITLFASQINYPFNN